MNGAHWHLVVNHLPIIVPMVGLFVMIAGLLFGSEILKRTAYCLFIFGAITAFAAHVTGEEAEEIVEKIPGIEEHYIEEHEEATEVFTYVLYGLGVLSLVGLWASLKEKPFSNLIVFLSILVSLAGMYFGKQAGTTGGEIRHTEIRTTPSIPAEHTPDDD